MAERPIYCHPVDVLRKFDPTLTESDLSNNDFIGNEDLAQVRARIDSVCSDFEDQTGHAFRRNRMGSPGATETYESQQVINTRPTAPLWASLDWRPVLPFDSASNDTLEIRTGKDSWDDVTDSAGSEFTLDHRTGRLKLYRILINRIFWGADDDRFLRATYRYGALGGDQTEGGQTTLDGGIADSDTSVDVANAARLPNRGIVLIANDEYARITDVDYSTDTLTLSRGERVTSKASHSDGDVVHFCPENVRDSVAAEAARELLLYDDWTDQLVDTGNGAPQPQQKLDDWESTWEQALGKHTEVRRL